MRTTIALTVVIGFTATLTLPNIEMSAQAHDQNNIFGPNSSMKFANILSIYMEIEEFKDSDHHTRYFCYNCIYFMKPNHCAIVIDEGNLFAVTYSPNILFQR